MESVALFLLAAFLLALQKLRTFSVDEAKWQKEVQYCLEPTSSSSSSFFCSCSCILKQFFLLCSHVLEHFVQAMLAEERIRVWGGNVELPQTQETGPSENIAAPI